MKSMKIIIIFLSMFITALISKAQSSESDLNGKIFRGKATEITPADIDRMPLVYDELIFFENGKLMSNVMKMYSADSCNFTSGIDGRRMIAVKVVGFNSDTSGKADGQDVNLSFSGNVYGDAKLSGTLEIIYPDGSEIRFLVYATAE